MRAFHFLSEGSELVDVLTEITIDRPRDQVSEYAANPDNVPEWYVNINFVEWRTPRQLEVGAEVAFQAAFLGKQLSMLFAPFMSMMMKRANNKDLKKIKFILERGLKNRYS